MAYKNTEQTLTADIPAKLFEEFDSQRRKRGQVKKEAVRAMVKLWVQLPEEFQAKLLNQSTGTDSFTDLIRQIVDEQIKKAAASSDRKKTS
jgi:hypothetical protein